MLGLEGGAGFGDLGLARFLGGLWDREKVKPLLPGKPQKEKAQPYRRKSAQRHRNVTATLQERYGAGIPLQTAHGSNSAFVGHMTSVQSEPNTGPYLELNRIFTERMISTMKAPVPSCRRNGPGSAQHSQSRPRKTPATSGKFCAASEACGPSSPRETAPGGAPALRTCCHGNAIPTCDESHKAGR